MTVTAPNWLEVARLAGERRAGPVVAALTDPGHLFTSAEVATLMRYAVRWGYEARVDEENEAWPPPPLFAAGEWIRQADRVDRRRRFDADRTPGFPGGLPSPVEVFPSDGRMPPFPRGPQPWLSAEDRAWIRAHR